MIKYENLYYINNEFVYITKKDINLDEVNIEAGLRKKSKFKPKKIIVSDINDFIKAHDFEIIENDTLLASHDYHHNIGHALYDVLYPLYLIYLIFNNEDNNKKFNIF